MSFYAKAEQETVYTYEPLDGYWRVYSSYPPHVRQLQAKAEIIRTDTDEAGKVIAVTGLVDTNQIRLFKPKK
ncbi:hypothetical protein [Gracilibacillus salinarum]|uniref:Uncharacterized protein n=1 Tax=Gracilibacillus salinarum TaxID=2932255 RepID=A0ABY4GPE6_9BACI|nr:hypothetical protein [Gracilibacillus salinarum]UOQ86202.1 hypothetical protein MUN87_04705 [Gracilibacillus salinarum]